MKTVAITGVLGYSGRYVAAEAVHRGWRVIGLTNSAGRLSNPACYELRPMPWSARGEDILRGVDVLVNTYWVRFSFNGAGHAAFSHREAVENTLALFRAAQQAGVRRVVHVSITKPDASSPLPYFRGKAHLEQALSDLGLPHSILRPAVLFGDTPQESILINNMAWSLRHLPCVGTFGSGADYFLQPVHVRDLAELGMEEAERPEPHRVVHATGPETYSFRDLWRMLAQTMGVRRLILPMPHWVGYAAASVLGALMHDVMLTRDEVRGLTQNRLAVDEKPAGKRSLRQWAEQHAQQLGRSYQSELSRRR